MKGKEAPLVSQKWMFHDPSKGRPFLRILAQQQGHQVPRISIRYLRKRKRGDRQSVKQTNGQIDAQMDGYIDTQRDRQIGEIEGEKVERHRKRQRD